MSFELRQALAKLLAAIMDDNLNRMSLIAAFAQLLAAISEEP